MGIRWYGWAVTPGEAEIARTEPWSVIRLANERHHRSGWTNGYLDKAWRYMQHLFAGDAFTAAAASRGHAVIYRIR